MTKFLVSVDETVRYQQLEIEADTREEAEEKYMDKLGNGYVLDVEQEYMYPKVYEMDGDGKVYKIYCDVCDSAAVRLSRAVDQRKDYYVCTMCRENTGRQFVDNTFSDEEFIDCSD